jgi:hypothetical protein
MAIVKCSETWREAAALFVADVWPVMLIFGIYVLVHHEYALAGVRYRETNYKYGTCSIVRSDAGESDVFFIVRNCPLSQYL